MIVHLKLGSIINNKSVCRLLKYLVFRIEKYFYLIHILSTKIYQIYLRIVELTTYMS